MYSRPPAAVQAVFKYALAASPRTLVTRSIYLGDQPNRLSATTCRFSSLNKMLPIPAHERPRAPASTSPTTRLMVGLGCPPKRRPDHGRAHSLGEDARHGRG